MFSKADIRKVTIGVQRNLCDELIHELGKAELIHLSKADFEGVPSDAQMDAELKKEEIKTRGIISLIESILLALDLEKDVFEGSVSRVTYKREIDNDEVYLNSVKKKIEKFQKLHSKISRKIVLALEQISSQEELSSIGIDAGTLKGMKLCSFVFGTVNVDPDEDISHTDDTSIIEQSGRHVIGIALSDKKQEKLEYLQRYGFEDETEKIISNELWASPGDHLLQRIHVLKGRLKRIENYINRMRDKWEKRLRSLYVVYMELETAIHAEKMFLFSRETMFVSGWIDTRNSSRLVDILHKICGESFLLTVSPKREKDAPVVLKNNRLLRPFELLVKNAGLPGNTELDPTPIAAITYVLMFGVMFGDIGQGLVLALTGFFLKFFADRRGHGGTFISNGGFILQACGVSAIIFGFFYGSFFSNEHLIPAIWFHPMEDIGYLFFSVIMMGIVFIVVAILLNIINCLLVRDYGNAFFGTRGLTGLVIYAGSVFMFIRYLKMGISPTGTELIAFIVFPIFIFSMRNVFGFLFFGVKHPFPNGIFEYVVETLVEIIEMFSSFFGNTISFIRAGAFALSHAGLSIAVYTLAGIVSPDITSIGSLAVIVVGNIFIILLEGLICGIQSMRLEYYEIFGKFFKGDGMGFAPFSLKKTKVFNGGAS